MSRVRLGVVLLAGLLPIANLHAQVPEILSTQPVRHAPAVSAAAAISIEFSENMTTATVNDSTLRVYGSLSGLHGGTMSWAMQQSELTFTPTQAFELGELVTVIVTTGVESVGGVPLAESHTWSFTITAGTASEAFGAAFKYPLGDWPHQMVAGDFNGDGDLDVLVAIGSHTGDVTVFSGDGTGALTQGASYVLPSRAEYLSTADLDADGDLEIVARHATVPYVSVMTDPIYGGVSASLALLGDINIAEPEARAGFAGPNIIEQTIRQKLPKGFQRSEFLLEHGAIDMIVHRTLMRDTIARLLSKLTHKALVPLEVETLPADGE